MYMYKADKKRYDSMQYNRCGKSGLKLPIVSLGLWHNFGDISSYDNMKQMCFTAFDNGITHLTLQIIMDRNQEVLKSILV
mgnify:CR=1 FL=1